MEERTTAEVTLERVDDPLLSIGEFSCRSRLSPKALRLYDRRGLLEPAHVDADTGYRTYRESQLATARLVAVLRGLDMSLAVVGELVTASDAERVRILDAYWDDVEERVASQRRLFVYLRAQLSGEGSYDMYDVQERDVPQQLVVVEQRHVRVQELPEWIQSAGTRLLGVAGEHGGVAGPLFVVYHGEVSEDSDGPVEVCVPISDEPRNGSTAISRREPAHREAYVRITKADVAYPQILSAYEAVDAWIRSRGGSASGSPREVYFTDWDAAAPNDEVCDVAFPIA